MLICASRHHGGSNGWVREGRAAGVWSSETLPVTTPERLCLRDLVRQCNGLDQLGQRLFRLQYRDRLRSRHGRPAGPTPRAATGGNLAQPAVEFVCGPPPTPPGWTGVPPAAGSRSHRCPGTSPPVRCGRDDPMRALAARGGELRRARVGIGKNRPAHRQAPEPGRSVADGARGRPGSIAGAER